MNDIEITDEEIIDLIFERKIEIGQCKISTGNSFHEILAKLEERLCYGKINRSETTAFCGTLGERNSRPGVKFIGRAIGSRGKKRHDYV